jgi:hypothetical protein
MSIIVIVILRILQHRSRKDKVGLCFISSAPRHDDVWGSGGIPDLSISTSILDGGECSVSCPGRYFSCGSCSHAVWWGR